MMNETQLEETAVLDYNTAEFLNKQADELLPLLDDDKLTYQEKEQVALQLESLLGKIHFELKDTLIEPKI
jgi:hypothetical protein